MTRIAVIGAGYWGPNLVRNFDEHPEVSQVVVCDQDSQKLARLAESYPPNRLAFTTDAATLWADPSISAVAVATEIPSHVSLAEMALAHGKHVFVEKPLAMRAAECKRLGALATAYHLTLMVGHTYAYNPALQQLKTLLDEGCLGDVYYLHSQRLNLGRVQTEFNALWSLAVHDISIALTLFEERPESVQAWGQAFITPGIEDIVFVLLRFPSGKLAHLHVSWLDPEKKRQVTLVGSKKMAVYDDVALDRKITLYDKGIDKSLKDNCFSEYQDFSEFQLLVRSGDIQMPHVNFKEPLKLECQHFLDCVTGREARPKTGWQEAYEVVAVLEAAQASLESAGTSIPIAWEEEVQTSSTVGQEAFALPWEG